MNREQSAQITILAFLVALVCGCTKEESSPCENLEKITDPSAKAELEKRCGRGGPEFKRTPHKAY